jgi:hypothetical protein
VRDAQRDTDLAAGEALAQGKSENVSNLSHGETGSGQVNLLGVMSEAGCLPSFTSRQPYTTSVGVYENPGMGVRIRPERVYEISRNPHCGGAGPNLISTSNLLGPNTRCADRPAASWDEDGAVAPEVGDSTMPRSSGLTDGRTAHTGAPETLGQDTERISGPYRLGSSQLALSPATGPTNGLFTPCRVQLFVQCPEVEFHAAPVSGYDGRIAVSSRRLLLVLLHRLFRENPQVNRRLEYLDPTGRS